MRIAGNKIADSLYNTYTNNLRAVAQSARRLAWGEHYPTNVEGRGELGVANMWRSVIRGQDKLVDGVQSSINYLRVQDESMVQAAEVLQRMNELASAALDNSKNTNDRVALDAEFQALENEFSQIQARNFNTISLFGRSLDVRIGVDIGNVVTLSAISLNALTFGSMALSQLASASSAIVSLTSRLSSLNVFRARSGNNSNELTRSIDFTRQFVRQMGNAENFVRNIDIALETGSYTKRQVILQASQSILHQANKLPESGLQFI